MPGLGEASREQRRRWGTPGKFPPAAELGGARGLCRGSGENGRAGKPPPSCCGVCGPLPALQCLKLPEKGLTAREARLVPLLGLL